MSILDLFTIVPIIILILAIFWLYNREIQKTLEQTKISEQILAKERDSLQTQMGERTRELRENRMARMNDLAKAAEFGRLSQGLFHDLMTPLTSMVLHADKLQDPRFKEASDRMTSYISDIRSTLSREEIDRDCSLKEELENVLHLLAYKTRTAGIKISVNEEGSCTWHGNPIKIRQVFSNLISNAIDSYEGMNDKKVIRIDMIDDGNKNNIIKIADSGSGIKEENIGKIFQPFFTTKSPDKGTGIGLTTVKNIVENDLKGSIQAQNNQCGGALFTVTFPNKPPFQSR